MTLNGQEIWPAIKRRVIAGDFGTVDLPQKADGHNVPCTVKARNPKSPTCL
jgi:hypothetical protein